MIDVRFPRWSAPIVGAALGALLSPSVLDVNDESSWWLWLMGPAIGVACGLLILLFEPPTTLSNGGQLSPTDSCAESSLAGRLLALLSLLLFWFPFIGWGLCLMAIIANRNDSGWPWVVSWITLSLAGIEIAIFTAFLLLDKLG